MISSIKRATFKILLLVLLYAGASYSKVNEQDYSHISMKNYQVINGSKGSLIISKSFRHVTFSNGRTTLNRSAQSKNKDIFELNLRNPDKEYSMFVESSRVGVLVADRSKLQNETACLPNLKDPIETLLKNDITSKIEDFAYSESLFDESCSSVSSELAGYMANELNPKESMLVKCMNSKELNAALAKNTRLATVANSALAGYMANVSQIENGTAKLQIKCEEIAKTEYDPKNQTISLAMKNESLVVDQCKTVSQVISHELLHHIGLNEEDTQFFDSVCGNALKAEGTKNPSCKEVYSHKLETGCGPSCVRALQKTQKNKDTKVQKEITAKVVEEIKTAEFVPVQDADIQEITNPTTPERYNRSVDRVYTAMSTNLEKMAEPLNRAIASTVTTAEAGTRTAAKKVESTYKKSVLLETSSRSPASKSKATENQEYVVEEILADKYNVPVSTVRAAAAGTSSPELPSTAQAPATTGANTTNSQVRARGASSEVAGGGASAGAGTNLGSARGGVPGRSTSSRATNTRTPASAGGSSAQDNTVQELSSFNEIRGERYRKIQERYSDPEFRNQLRDQNVAIEYKTDNMTTRIGDTSASRKALFRDDGSVLKKVTGAR